MYDFIGIYPIFGYLLIFLLMPIGGTATLLFASFLAQRGFFDFRIVMAISILAEITGDIFWYFLGAFIGRYFLNGQNNFLSRKMNLAKKFFDKYHFWAIFISKFIYGLGQPVLIFSGATFQKFKKVFTVILFSAPIWAGVVGSFGYFFSLSISSVRHFLLEAALVLAVFILIIYLGKFIIQRYIVKFLKNNNPLNIK